MFILSEQYNHKIIFDFLKRYSYYNKYSRSVKEGADRVVGGK